MELKNRKGIENHIISMVHGFLTDPELMEPIRGKIIKALERNFSLTSVYSLDIAEVQDIKGKTPDASGFYITLEGTRCKVCFFVSNGYTVTRKPDKRKVEVKYSYKLYDHLTFCEAFWRDNF